MTEIRVDNFDLEQIAESGQCFRFKRLGEYHYSVVAFGRYLEMRQEGNMLYLSCDEEEWKNIWYDYFDMGTDYGEIEKLVKNSGDVHLNEAFGKGFGIRILKQDLWEIVISFIISQNNNIPRIKKIIEGLCHDAGKEIEGHPGEYAFPSYSDLEPSYFCDGRLHMGYRVAYLKAMFEFVAAEPGWLDSLHNMSYEVARFTLLKRLGIGPKVADCILLFGLHHVEAFPVDTHVKQLLSKYYPSGFNFEYFSGVAGIIQQYLFYYELLL